MSFFFRFIFLFFLYFNCQLFVFLGPFIMLVMLFMFRESGGSQGDDVADNILLITHKAAF